MRRALGTLLATVAAAVTPACLGCSSGVIPLGVDKQDLDASSSIETGDVAAEADGRGRATGCPLMCSGGNVCCFLPRSVGGGCTPVCVSGSSCGPGACADGG